jgi:hypothetical protein
MQPDPASSSASSLSSAAAAALTASPRWPASFGGVLLALACSDGATVIDRGENTERADTAVVVAILTRSPDDTFQTYLLASERAPEGTLELSNALELPDALVTQNDQAIFIGDNERLVFQRYEVNVDYSFSLTGEFSLQGYGVDYINNQPLFFSATTAYYVDAPRGQIIVFDPTSMQITGDIQVSELLRDDYYVWLGPSHRVGDRYLAAVLYTNEDWTATAPDSTVGIILEDDSNEPIRFLRDERGVGAYLSLVDSRGDMYMAADALSGDLALSGREDVPSSRVLRVQNGADAVDASFMLDLGQLLDTPATFGFWPVASDKFVVQAWASDVDPSEVLEPGTGGWGSPYYDWRLVDIASGTAQPVRGLERSVANNTIRLALDGQTYLQQSFELGGRSELYALNADASAVKVAESEQGEFWFMGRVRRAVPRPLE